jgi:hypothetical protein
MYIQNQRLYEKSRPHNLKEFQRLNCFALCTLQHCVVVRAWQYNKCKKMSFLVFDHFS